MILTSMVCACLMAGENSPPSGSPATMGAQQQKPFIERFDELTLVEAVELLISEGYQSGYAGVSSAFTPNEPVGELKQSFANGLKQIRLSSGLRYDDVKSHIVVTKTSLEVAVNEYKGDHYNQALPGLIGGIRSYVGDTRATLLTISFTGRTLQELTPWFLYVVLDKNKKWRVDAATPKLPIIVLRLRPEFFVPPVG